MHDILFEFQTEILRLKWLTALNDLETAVRRHHTARLRALADKAGFRPDQPRVPAGNPDGGQWTHEGGDADDTQEDVRLLLATDEQPEIPKRPPTPEERLAAAKEYARRLAALGRLARRAPIIGWLLDFEPEIRSYQDEPRSFWDMSQRALERAERGYQNHHVAEQDAAYRAGFPGELIESTINVVRIPTWKHHEITGLKMTALVACHRENI
jgi:hypothetical protein